MKRFLWLAAGVLAGQIALGQNVLVQRADDSRAGANLGETILNLSNVNSAAFGKVFTLPVDGYVFAQPLYVSGLSIPGQGARNVVFVATQHDSVYAFDADSGVPLWQRSLGTAVTETPGNDIEPEVGITSTPVINLATDTMYVVAKSVVSGSQQFAIHALDITTGADRTPSAVIAPTAAKTGGGTIALNPDWHYQRPGLVLVNGVVYVAFASRGDFDTWQGWVVGFNAGTLAQVSVFCTQPSGLGGGGIWTEGEAPPVDASGDLYVSTGDGAFDQQRLWGNAFLKLGTSGGLSVLDYFAPYNQVALGAANLDISSAGYILLPDSAGTAAHPHIMVASGKAGAIYLLDRDNMGHFNGSYTHPDAQIIQEIPNAIGVEPINPSASTLPYVENNYGTPTYWNNSIYWCGVADACKQFALSNGLLSTSPVSATVITYAYPGAEPVISASSSTATTAIMWVVERDTTDNISTLHAYDARNLGSELYNSNEAPARRDVGGPPVKFIVPTVINGKVYVAAQHEVDVYGVLANNLPALPAPAFGPAGGVYASAQTVSIADTYGDAQIYYTVDGSNPTTSSTLYQGPIGVSGTTTINAIAVLSGYRVSPVASATYTIGAAPVGFVQGNFATPQLPESAVTVTYTQTQKSADLNVVVVGWNDTTHTVSSVADSSGNLYTLAVGPTVQSGTASQAIYYAKNIAGASENSNTVTVTFNGPAAWPDVRVAEYSGLDPGSALDVTAAATGSGASSSSGAATTTSAKDIIIGANLVQTGTTGAGSGFTSRMITVPDGDILEDEIVSAAGSYTATAPMSSGGWIMQMAAFRQRSAGGGGPSPTAPTALSATAVSGSGIDLSWGGATETGGTISQYLIERCAGSGCTSFTQVATSATTSFNDTGLTGSTSYTYRVRAQDTTGASGPYSNTSTAMTLAAVVPTAPSSLTASAVSSTQISLSWSASTEVGGTVAQYLIERCQGSGCTNFAQLGTSATTSFSDSGLSGSTSYSYRVRAQDTVGNDGPYSSVASTSTAAPTLTAPTGLTVSAVSSTQISLAWGAASETGGSIGEYLIERCQGAGCSSFSQVGTSTSTSYSDTGLAASTTYTYRIRAEDALGNIGPYSSTASATTSAGQTQSIAFVQSNYATPQSAQTTVSVYYTKAQTAGDLNVVVVGWNDSTQTITSVTDTSGNAYTLAVGPTVQSGTASQAIYYAKNIASAAAGVNAVTVTFSGGAAYPDIRVAEYGGIATTSPLDVTAAAMGSGASSSSGAATTTFANDLIIGANLVQTGTTGAGSGFTSRMITVPDGDIVEDEIVAVTGSYAATAPLSSGKWIMQMVAFRQMSAGGGGPSPTAPTALSATAVSGSGIDLSWGASTETGGTISQYLIERCAGSGCTSFAQVGTSATTSFNDTGLTGSTSYTYRVRAQDTTGTDGPYSSTASATTSAGQTAPIAFVQSNYATPQTAQTTVSVYYTKAQTAGDLNVVVVGWNDSTQTITSVTDTSGNMYALAVGPTVQSGTASQAIYYAKNIASAAAGVNAVTVTFSGAAAYPDIRVAEYGGINTTSPLDVTAAAMGSGSSSSSGAATTTFANDLIIGANLVQTTTSGAGSGFKSRMITVPDGDILEDEIVSSTGSYTAAAPMSSGKWIMQMAAFKGQ